MSKAIFQSVLAAAALAAGAAFAQAPAMPPANVPDLAAFDASHTNSVAEKLVLCDTAAFLRTRPDLNATRMYARREGRPFQLMLGPYFVQGGAFYSERYERLFFKLQHQGLVSSRQIADIQSAQGREFITAYGRGRYLPNSFSADQSRYCTAFAKENGVSQPE